MVVVAIYNEFINETLNLDCVKSVCTRSYSGPYFSTFGLNTYSVQTRDNTDQNNSEYGHFLCSVSY